MIWYVSRTAWSLALVLLFVATVRAATPAEACTAKIEAYDAAKTDATTIEDARALERACRDDQKGLAHAISRRAHIHFTRGETKAAVDGWTEALALAPRSTNIAWSLCGALVQLGDHADAITKCSALLTMAREEARAAPDAHAEAVSNLGFNLAIARIKGQGSLVCFDDTRTLLQDFRDRHPDHGWVYQLLASFEWDCNKDCPAGMALYRKSCKLGHEPACQQIAATPSCGCDDDDGDSVAGAGAADKNRSGCSERS